jgi:1-acyl-sn-glycerol-3-phosphate acyltransferase
VLAPEGTRSPTEALIEGRDGASYLAAKTGVPVLPVALIGTEDRIVKHRLKHFQKLDITIWAGKTFNLPPLKGRNREEQLKQYTDEIMCQIGALLPPQYRGVYADHPRLKEILAQQEKVNDGTQN